MNSRDNRSGVTLLEVLVVLAIIAMIATIATPRLMQSFGRAQGQAAVVQMNNVAAAIQMYYLDTGQFPSESDGLSALVTKPNAVNGWYGPYIDSSALSDPWGRAWIYRQPGREDAFDLMTLGQDGQPGGSNEDKDISL